MNFIKFKVSIKDVFWIVLFIAGLFAALYILTGPALIERFNFQGTGAIGDTIGGITSPFINLLGAVLVYYSFKAQIQANRKQFKILEKQMEDSDKERNNEAILRLFNSIKDNYTNLKFGKRTGRMALIHFFKSYLDNKSSSSSIASHYDNIVLDFNYILYEYELLLRRVNSANLRSDEELQLIKLVLKYYDTHLENFAKILSENEEEISTDFDVDIGGDFSITRFNKLFNHLFAFQNISSVVKELEDTLISLDKGVAIESK